MRGQALFATALLLGILVGSAALAEPVPAPVPQRVLPSTPTPSEMQDEPPRRSMTTTLDRDGKLVTEAYACPPAAGCRGGPLGGAPERSWGLSLPGELESLDLTLTWKPTAEAMATLRFGAYVCPVGKEGCAPSDALPLAEAEGPSPLRIHAEGLGIEKGRQVLIVVWRPDVAPGVQASAEQPFHVEGKAKAWL